MLINVFLYLGNVRLLCITDDVSISVNLPLPPGPGTGASHLCSGSVRHIF